MHARTVLPGFAVPRSARPPLAVRVVLKLLPCLAAAFLLVGVFDTVAAEVAASIATPAANASVRGDVSVTGSAMHDQFDYYKVEVGAGANPNDWIVLGGLYRQQVNNGELARFNTATVPDGVYTIRLRVVDKTGNYAEARQRIKVVNTEEQPTSTPKPSPGGSITPSPTAGTPTVTPTFQVPTVPTIVVPAKLISPTAGATPQPSGVVPTVDASTKRPTAGFGLDLSKWLEPFLLGMAAAAAAFVLFGAIQLLRR